MADSCGALAWGSASWGVQHCSRNTPEFELSILAAKWKSLPVVIRLWGFEGWDFALPQARECKDDVLHCCSAQFRATGFFYERPSLGESRELECPHPVMFLDHPPRAEPIE